MKRKKIIKQTSLIFSILALVVFLYLYNLGDPSNLRVYKFEYRSQFTEPIENLVILYNDMTGWKLTSFDEHKVSDGLLATIENILKYDKKSWEEIVLIVHNHWGEPRLSQHDKKFEYLCRQRGFKGLFLVYNLPKGELVR